MGAYRSEVVRLAQSWIGLKESDGSYKKIIDIYNGYKGKIPRGIKMRYDWAWCACTWSAIAIKLGYTDIMPIEISCQELIKAADKKKIWMENDGYVPSPGDAILYDWNDNGVGDCMGWADHVGIVETVSKDAGYFVVIEGNYQNAVKRRTISINGRYIRGFITPKYDKEPSTTKPSSTESNKKKTVKQLAHEVLVGKWGVGEDRKKRLEAAGYNYQKVQDEVNWLVNGGSKKNANATDLDQPIKKRVIATAKPHCLDKTGTLDGPYITTANLYCRNDVGTNKKALCQIPKGTTVTCYGQYSVDSTGVKWLYVQVILDGVLYNGFSCSTYLKRKL